MGQLHARNKRKRSEAEIDDKSGKRRAIPNTESASSEIELLERRITEDPSKNCHDLDTMIQMFDLAKPNARTNLRVGVALCKVFSRLIVSGSLTKNDHGSKRSQKLAEWYVQQYGYYRMTIVKLLRTASAAQRLPIVQLCWRVLEQDAELLDHSVWVSGSIFKPLLSALIELPDAKDIREIYVGEYMNSCHDCYYRSLECFSYV